MSNIIHLSSEHVCEWAEGQVYPSISYEIDRNKVFVDRVNVVSFRGRSIHTNYLRVSPSMEYTLGTWYVTLHTNACDLDENHDTFAVDRGTRPPWTRIVERFPAIRQWVDINIQATPFTRSRIYTGLILGLYLSRS